MRDSAIIYRSYYESIKQLPLESQARIWDAIFELSFNFTDVKLEGIEGAIFGLIKPIIEANNKRFENGKQPKKKQNGSKTEAKDKQTESKHEGNKDKEVDKDKDKDKENRIPSIEDVVSFFKSNGYKADIGMKAWNYYNDANWKDRDGKKVRNWKQKMRGVWFKDENKAPIVKQTYNPDDPIHQW